MFDFFFFITVTPFCICKFCTERKNVEEKGSVKCSYSWVKSQFLSPVPCFLFCLDLSRASSEVSPWYQNCLNTHICGDSFSTCVCVHVYNWMFRREAMKWTPFQKPLFVLASFSSPFLLIIWRTLACAWCPSKWEEPSANRALLFKPSVIALKKPLQSPACCPCFCLSNSCVEVGCTWSSSRRRAAKIMREGAGESENASHLTRSEKRENGSLWSRML